MYFKAGAFSSVFHQRDEPPCFFNLPFSDSPTASSATAQCVPSVTGTAECFPPGSERCQRRVGGDRGSTAGSLSAYAKKRGNKLAIETCPPISSAETGCWHGRWRELFPSCLQAAAERWPRHAGSIDSAFSSTRNKSPQVSPL